ncbi:LLM class flavin-dependent oxidoreductase [Microbacterium sp. No. 7]|uniref:LLM class flavin-dependent oxidoreductase n=1 Tax=Microbacterium sp. No. 7 TaxID=1714373 RepID=UPI0006D1C0C7|nr:LLM class flavin-dependent oxidoreductase [Microbacterium sp. No. 7]ALJ18661.1 FMNH2-dependent monooxygenase [Microbacterium sp. No. 7]
MTTIEPLRLGVALEGAGWHPSAWREPSSRPHELFTAAYWADLIGIADRAGIDFATIEDELALQSSDALAPDDRTDEVRGRLDALLIAARVAPVTERIGLVPTVTTTHTEPFHVSKAVATLDHVSEGRAGWRAKVSARPDAARHFGRRETVDLAIPLDLADERTRRFVEELFAEAADVVEIVRRLWDSWEDDAEIRDVQTDRFLDADRLHTIDFESERFRVRGPSITPRPPQGQPVVTVLAHSAEPYRLAATSADVVFVTPRDAADAAGILAEVRAIEAEAERSERLRVFADLVVFLDAARPAAAGPDATETATPETATPETDAGEPASARLARLDALGGPLSSDARVFAGSAAQLADEIAALHAAGYDGVRLRPGVATDDLPRIADDLVPELRRRGLLASDDDGAPVSLRARLGLTAQAPNRYAPALAG